MIHNVIRLSCLTMLVLFTTFSGSQARVSNHGNEGFRPPVQYAKEDPALNGPAEPFRIIGNIYYVGASDVTSFLITTSAGHILLDGCFNETAPRILANVRKLGFDPKDIKVLLNSHAHYDHAGGLAAIKESTGAKLYASRQDAPLLESGGRGDYLFGDRLLFRPVKVDRLLDDGDTVELGGVVLTAHLTPGHTKGDTTWTMRVTEGEKDYDVVFVGSMSVLPGVKLVGNKRYPTIADDYAKSFRVLKSLHCDVFLGSHGSFFALQDKIKRLAQASGPNPFIDSARYTAYVENAERVYLDELKREQAMNVK